MQMHEKRKCMRFKAQTFKRENKIPDLQSPWGGEFFAVMGTKGYCMVHVFSLQRGLMRGFLRPLGSSAGRGAWVEGGVKRGAGCKCSDCIMMTCAVSPGAAINDAFSSSCFIQSCSSWGSWCSEPQRSSVLWNQCFSPLAAHSNHPENLPGHHHLTGLKWGFGVPGNRSSPSPFNAENHSFKVWPEITAGILQNYGEFRYLIIRETLKGLLFQQTGRP